MTLENRRKNIAFETRRGDESLESAEILCSAGKLADAVSLAYYAAFHYARAMLLTIGEGPKTRVGVERMIQRRLVRTGALDHDVAHLLSHLQNSRQDADYTAEFVFTAAAATEELDAARRFIAEARTLLHQGGWTSAE